MHIVYSVICALKITFGFVDFWVGGYEVNLRGFLCTGYIGPLYVKITFKKISNFDLENLE